MTKILAALLTLIPTLAWAAARDDVVAGVMRCASITDNRSWLNCFYGSAQPMRQQLGLPPAPATQTQLVPPPASSQPMPAPIANAAPPRQSRSFFGDVLGGRILINKMAAASYNVDAQGRFTVTLTDGQVWRQVAGDDSFAHWSKPASHYLVTIKEGALGSYSLEVPDDNRLYKVNRIR